jgi:hypothetical protein
LFNLIMRWGELKREEERNGEGVQGGEKEAMWRYEA